jgi:hypothetical protein
VKTARFTKVVGACGEPENYLLLMEPAKDRTLQQAVKANRVMTVSLQIAGTKTDHGEVGFEPGPGRQFLVFPKTLRAFAGHRVVGINYNLLNSQAVPKSERAVPTPPRKAPKAKPAAARRGKPPRAPEVSRNVVTFKSGEDEEEIEEVAELKKQVRHAMAVLEKGKPVAAFNLLKRIEED